MWDCTLADYQLSPNHFFIDIVIGDNLITALKDEGAANSFITKGLVDLCRLESELLNDKGDSEDFTGPDGSNESYRNHY